MTNCTAPSHCSFCAKTSNEVAKLIAGPTVFICDECVILCMDIVEAEGIPTPRTELRKWAVKQAVELHQSCGNYVGRNPTDTAGEFVKFVTEPMPKPTLADAMVSGDPSKP